MADATDSAPVQWLASADALNDGSLSDDCVVILPLGATEQHGQHLPLETDTLIARGVCERLAEQLKPEMPVFILPVEPVGYSPEHMDFAGSKTLNFDEAIDRWIEIGHAVARAGGRRFVMLNAHGGNSPLMTIVAQELRVRHSLLAVATSWTRFVKGTGIVSEAEEAFGIHGGDIETSVMLALQPQSVDMDKARDFPNLQEALALDFTHLRAYGPHAFGWKAADLNRIGVTGNAGLATAEKGTALLNQAVVGLAELIYDVARFDLALLKDD